MSKKNKDKVCFGDFCMEKRPLEKSIEFAESKDIKDSDVLLLNEECNLLEPTYVKHHLLSAINFFVYFAFFGILITILHELFTLFAYLLFDYKFHIIIVTIDSGEFISNIPSSAPYGWYIFAYLCPYLFIEGSILLVMLFTIRIEGKATYLDNAVTSKLKKKRMKQAI